MRNLLLSFAVIVLFYGCTESSGKEIPKSVAADVRPPDHLRIGKTEALKMRSRRGKDDASVKISAMDLQSLIGRSPSPTDTFVFYFVKYDPNSLAEKGRYTKRVAGANWSDVAKKPSTLLVGYMGSDPAQTGMRLGRTYEKTLVSLYDLAVLCPPPPDCNCEIEQ